MKRYTPDFPENDACAKLPRLRRLLPRNDAPGETAAELSGWATRLPSVNDCGIGLDTTTLVMIEQNGASHFTYWSLPSLTVRLYL